MTNELMCPRCFQLLRHCQGQHDPLPNRFAEKCRNAPPLWITQSGFVGHGKTVYLAALTLMLEELGLVVPGFSLDFLGDQHSFETIRDMRRRAAEHEVSEATRPRPPIPLFMQVPTGLLGTGARKSARTLVFYDAAGESFCDMNTLRDKVPSVIHSDVLWFLVSLHDLKTSGEQLSLSDLFQTYRSAMESDNRTLARRKIVVVLTKADLIEHQISKEFGNAVNDYLADDPFRELALGASSQTCFSLTDFRETATPISDLLREFICRSAPGGRNFVRLAESHGVEMRFCVTSALGHEPDQQTGKFVEKAIRYRVLDPFFWTILLFGESTSADVPRLSFALDVAQDSSSIFVGDRPAAIWETMSRYANTTTYYLGQSRPIAMEGQPPKFDIPWRRSPRLIGPILETLRADELVLVVTSGKIIDLPEFKNSPWRDRVLLAVTEESLRDTWPHVWLLRDGDDYDTLLQHLLQLRDKP